MMCLPLIAIIFQLVNYCFFCSFKDCFNKYSGLHNESSILLITLSALLMKKSKIKINVHLHIRLCLFVLQACGIDEEPKSI